MYDDKNIETASKELGFYEVLGPNNTVSDFVTELYTTVFREIMGDETMDRTLGSFTKEGLFDVMAFVFLQDGTKKLYEMLYDRIKG